MGDVPDRMFVAFDLLSNESGWRSFRWQDGILVAAWLRHATGQRFRIEGWNSARIDAYISGHQSKGQENQRLSYVPLPSIGHEHADGRHRRVLVALPFGDEGEAISILDRMTGDELISLTGEPMAWLARGQPDGVLKRYISESVEWLSVTPVVIHGLDCDKGRFRPRKAEKLILQAFHESGYNIETVEEFSYQSAPFWPGAGAARHARVPKHLDRWPRYHISVVFKKPVKGPVIVGIGRHCGLGVFATP
jgi:CRISPR-associated protein Csb2